MVIVNKIRRSDKNKTVIEAFEELRTTQIKRGSNRSESTREKGKLGFQYDAKEGFQTITNELKDRTEELLKESKSNTKSMIELNSTNFHVKPLYLLNEK